jgi:hypothetical protein
MRIKVHTKNNDIIKKSEVVETKLCKKQTNGSENLSQINYFV